MKPRLIVIGVLVAGAAWCAPWAFQVGYSETATALVVGKPPLPGENG